MSRMSREFSLVLLGAGILTAGYFLAPSPEDELDAKAEEQAAERVYADNSNPGSRPYRSHHVIIWVHSPAYAAARPMGGVSTVSRGGFGGGGRAFAAGA